MAKEKKAEKATKIKKKHWYQIVASKSFRNTPLGETLITDAKKAVGKHITCNLSNITNDFKKQHINVEFLIDGVENNRAYASVIGYEMAPASIKRLTRRRRDKIETSFPCITADGKNVRIKVILFTISLAKGSVKKMLFSETVNSVKKEVAKIKFEDLIMEIMANKFQKGLSLKLKKIYPLKIVEVKYLKIIGESAVAPIETGQETAPSQPEEAASAEDATQKDAPEANEQQPEDKQVA